MRRRKKPMLPKTPVYAEIEGWSHDCRGIARINGKTTFIQGALPGEQVHFKYLSQKKDFDQGEITEIIKPSKHRVDPVCSHYDRCGGCALQHLYPDTQVTEKEKILMDLFQKFCHKIPDNTLPRMTDLQTGYRHKARLSVKYVEKKQSVLVGFRERNQGRFITEISTCPILQTKLGENIMALRDMLNTLSGKKCISQVEVAAGDIEHALIFRHLEPLSSSDIHQLIAFGQDQKFHIYLQPGGEDSVHRVSPETQDPCLSYSLPDYDLTLYFHPTDFTQVNPGINKKMIKQAIDLLDIQPDDKILDLYCGLGNFSLPLARLASEVIGVEGSQRMVDRATMNARRNDMNNVSFYLANLDDPQQVKDLKKHDFNKLLLDPSRAGAVEVVNAMHHFMPETIVYVSCNPVSLARDASILMQAHGYHLKSAGVMDMFPHTSHVESMALFVR